MDEILTDFRFVDRDSDGLVSAAASEQCAQREKVQSMSHARWKICDVWKPMEVRSLVWSNVGGFCTA